MKTNDIDKIKTKMRNNLPQEKNKYTCIFHCPITVNDCINSIDLNDDKVIIGTLMGDVFLCRIDENRLYLNPKNKKKTKIPPLNLKNILENDNSTIQLKAKQENNELDNIKLPFKDNIRNDTNNMCLKDLFPNNYDTTIKKIYTKKEKKEKKIIKFPKITHLIIRSKENIPSLEFVNSDIINICIGDLEIIHLENMSSFNKNDENSTYNYSKLRNYKTENDHLEYCESAFCFLKNSCFLILFTKSAEFEEDLETSEINYENKNLSTGEIIKGQIILSNFVVPFDFNGDMFLFVDYKSKEEKFIGIEYTSSLKDRYTYKIKDRKKFGHISHMKIMTNDIIFLVRNEIQCEIRYINENFDIIEKYQHNGIEVISCCFFRKENEESLINIINDIEYEANIKNNKGFYNKIDRELVDNNVLKLFENKFNSKDNKENSTLINSNITFGNAHNKKRKDRNNKNIESDNLNNLNIYGKSKRIISSLDNNIINNDINVYNHTEISVKKRNLGINSNKNSNNASIDKSSSSRKNIKINLNQNFLTIDCDKNLKKGFKIITSNKILDNNKRKSKYKMKNFSSIEIYDKTNKKENKNIQEENRTIMKPGNSYREYNIITLDINGAVYLYHRNSQNYLFNIYDINNIKQKYKNINFFGMGFPYYIVANEKYFGITTDFGLFVFSEEN